MMRISLLAALILAAATLPTLAEGPVQGVVHGTAEIGQGAVQGDNRLAGLPLEQRVAEMRRPEVRKALIDAQAEGAVQLLGFNLKRFERMFLMGEPANYEPDPSTSVAAQAAANSETRSRRRMIQIGSKRKTAQIPASASNSCG